MSDQKLETDKIIDIAITPDYDEWRLDAALAGLLPDYSRARLQRWIKDGFVTVNGQVLRGKDKVFDGDAIVLHAQPEQETQWQPQALALDIVYEDDALLIINKPPGVVVHPAAGNREGTLVNALLHYAPELAVVPRAGLVHRLDKDTSGLLVIARTLEAHTHLTAQMQARTVTREYDAVVYGTLVAGGTVEAALGRHPVDRQRRAVITGGKHATTHYRIHERFAHFTWLRVKLETGRTHQIRVHMAHIQHPVVGDPVYARLRIPKSAANELRSELQGFTRQALHAGHLALQHPVRDEVCAWSVPMPQDMQHLLAVLRAQDPP